MSTFSDYLSRCIDRHVETAGCSKNELIRSCQVNRSTFFQCMRGDRLPTEQLFHTLLERMKLAAEEQEALERRYRLAQLGEERYRRRLAVLRCLEAFSVDLALPEDWYPPQREETLPAQAVLCGREQVLWAMREMTRLELGREKPCMDLFLPMKLDSIFGQIQMAYRSCGKQFYRLRQMVQLPREAEGKELETLALMRRMPDILINDFKGYEAHYYYADTCSPETLGVFYPYTVVTSGEMLLLNRAQDMAVLSSGPQVQMCRKQFQDNLNRTRPFFCPVSESEKMKRLLCRWRGEKLRAYRFAPMPLYAAHLPVALTAELVRRYCPKELQSLTLDYYRGLKRNADCIDFFSRQGICTFARTGVLLGTVPHTPIQPEDRKRMMEALLRGPVKQKRLIMVDENQLPISMRCVVTALEGNMLLLRSWEGTSARTYQFLEQNLLESFVDFFQGLAEETARLEHQRTEAVLREAIALCQ